MSTFQIRNLLLNSLLLFLLFSACSPEILKKFRKNDTSEASRNDFYPFFPAADTTQLFNMQVDFRKNHLSGLLLIKSTQPDGYRLVFTTHFGMSVFDLEFDKDAFRINYCIEALNKKRVIQLLENDFRILLFLNLKNSQNLSNNYRNKNNPVLEINRVENNYYLKDTKNETLLAIEAPHFISSLSYRFTGYIDRFPSVIQIKHSRIGLKMQLEKLQPHFDAPQAVQVKQPS
jgi:hypothetical protein